MNFRQTRHQTARGARADAEDDRRLYLLKKVSALHATYQVRLLAYRAQREGKQLVIRVPHGFKARPSLEALMVENPGLIYVEKS